MKYVIILIVNLERVFRLSLENIDLERAVDIILESIEPIKEREIVNLEDGLGRVLSEDFYAPMDNPPFDRSPLDGFALRSVDTKACNRDKKVELKVIDVVYAGSVSDKKLKENECIRIMTGGKMPEGSDCVIRLEDVEEKDKSIVIDQELKEYDNYVFKGEDIKKGSLLIEKGVRLNFSHIGVLGSMGQAKLEVVRKPRVAILGTGDELLACGEELVDGKIYDTNSAMLGARMRELGFDYKRIESGKDDPELVGQIILDNIDDFDLMITTGGVSVGDKDIFHEVIDLIDGERLFWRVRIKPGTPVMYSLVKNKPLLSLSGNPFAALTNFELLGRPIVAKLTNDDKMKTRRVKAVMKSEFPKGSKRIRRFVRCIYRDGEVYLPERGHSSGSLSSMTECNGLIDMKLGLENLKLDDQVDVILI